MEMEGTKTDTEKKGERGMAIGRTSERNWKGIREKVRTR
jgi:hypothetical protein